MTALRRITLARRPSGQPVPEDFALETAPLPEPARGEALVQTRYLSLDPYMRGRMDDAKSYAPAVEIGSTMTGQGTGRVLTSRADGLAEGDLVTGLTGWASHAVLPASQLRRLPDPAHETAALGVLGMPGFTAWVGLREYAALKPGETLAVAAATGPVGSMVGQLARLKGLRTLAIAGGAEKCALARETFGFDTAIDHRAHDDVRSLRRALAEAAPDGIDIYWENVGGRVLEAVLPLMNVHGRIQVCGTIAWYGGFDEPGADRLPMLWRQVLVRRLHINGLIVFDHWAEFDRFLSEVAPKVADGEITWLEDIAKGLEAAPEAFIGLLQGRNRGKQLVRVT
jgi:NADPH-dependent curcumin reductase CurA